MSELYDLDVTFEENEPDISGLSSEQLKEAVGKLPESLRPVAQGLLVEQRTMSDVSQQLALRQAELVTRLRRAKVLIAGYST